ncbi:hypothetical protein UT300012_23040 [Paraclostridium bifermentans]
MNSRYKLTKLVKEDIPGLLSNLAYEDDNYEVTFAYAGYDESLNKHYLNVNGGSDYCNMISVIVSIRDRETNETVSSLIPALKMPVPGELGFKTGKSNKQILDLYKKATGWYVLPPKKSEDAEDTKPIDWEIQPTLEFTSNYRSKFDFICKGQDIYFRDSSGKTGPKLGIFLRALTGMGPVELINILGNSKYLVSTLRDKESTESCINKLGRYMLPRKIAECGDVTRLYSDIQNRMFQRDVIGADKAGKERYKINVQFSRRAYNRELAETIEVDGAVVKKGTILSADILKRIDASNIDTLKINYKNKIFTLKKFEAEEDRLSMNEIFTMLNMYLNTLDGYEIYEQQYELTSRVLETYEDNVIICLTRNIRELLADITENLSGITTEENVDLRHIMSITKSLNLELLLDDIKNVDNTAMQVSKNTNIIELHAVNNKLTTDYGGKAAEDAVKVQDTEKGRMDPIDQPESSKIGKVHYKTIHAREDKYGFQTAPYIRVVNGVPDRSKVVYLTAAQEDKSYIAEWCEDFSKPKVDTYFDGTIVQVDRNRVDYMEYSPTQSMSLARSIIAFQEFSNAKRLLMGSNHLKQAIPTLKAEFPIVSTGTFGLQPLGVTKAKDILQEHYTFNKRVINLSEEEFINQPIKLIRTSIKQGIRYLTFKVIGEQDLVIDTTIPYMDASDAKSMYSTTIVPKLDHTYRGEDIVTHNINVAIGIPEREQCVDFGAATPSTYSEDFALGVNLFAGFKTFESSTIEDAISIRRGICFDGTLTSVSMMKVNFKCFSNDEFIEYFSCAEEKVEEYMDSNGLPRIGTYLKPGSTVMYKTREDRDGKRTLKRKQLDNNTSGHVINVSIQGNEAIVSLASVDTAEVGDKMSGRYGNKGVIAKVVDDSDMPFCEETGRPLDVCLNPLGIPSRMNISQLLEISLSMCCVKQGTSAIVSPFHPEALDFVKRKRQELDVKPLWLRDGRTGERIKRPVECGYMYMLKLEHMAKKKIASVNICDRVNKITAQPQKGSGAQSVGEMETWVLGAVGADKFLQELLSVQSDDLEALNYLEDLIAENPDDIEVEGTNKNNIILQTMLMTMNIELSNTEDGEYVLNPLTDEKTRQLASRPLDTQSSASLNDIDIFGKNLDSNVSRQINKKKFGYIDLGCEIVNPFWLERTEIIKAIPVLKVDEGKEKPHFLGDQDINNILNGAYALEYLEDEGVFKMMQTVKGGATSVSNMLGITTLLKELDLDDAIQFISNNASKFSQTRDRVLKNYNLLKTWLKDGLSLADLVISSYPIISPVYRPSDKDENMIHDLETFYTGLFSTVDSYKKNKADSRIHAIYKAIDRFLGVSSDSANDKKKSPLLKSFNGKGSDDKGTIRKHVLAKRVHFSGRSVITPSSDMTMKVDEIGVPILMAVSIWEKHLCAVLSRKSPITEYLPNLEVGKNTQFYKKIITYVATNNVYKFAREMTNRHLDEEVINVKELFFKTKVFIINWLEQQICTAGRQPSLHKFGWRAYKVRIRHGRTIEVHPLVCKGYNADFDGDTMHLEAVLTNSSKEEVMQKLTVKQSIINPKDSKPIVEHSQDMCLGVYFATMLYDNVTSIQEHPKYANGLNVYNAISLESLETLITTSSLELQDLVTVRVTGEDGVQRRYCSTAGRILFNSLIPGGFTSEPFTNTLEIPGTVRKDGTSAYSELKYDGLIAKKGGVVKNLRYFGLSDITTGVFEEYDIDTTMDMFQYVMEFGFRYSDISGISIGVDDICIDLGVDKYKEQARAKAEELNEAAMKGLISEAGRKRLLIDLYTPLGDYIKDEVNSRLPRNNNLFIIKDSGARGNDGQINQTLGLGGLTMKTLDESYEIPILNSYSQGLTSMEVIIASYGARQGVKSTQLGTAEAGYSTRQMVNMLQGLTIVDDDCGVEPTILKLKYTKPVKVVKHYMKSIWEDQVTPEGKTIRVEVGKEPATEEIKGDKNSLMRLIEGSTLAVATEETEKYLKHFLRMDKKLDIKTIDIIFKSNIRRIECKETTFEIFYELDEMYADYILNRITTDETLGGLRKIEGLADNEFIMTKNTKKFIEEHQILEIPMRNILECGCQGGICAKCFGEKFDERRLPRVGERVGIESAQSIGEPAAQLVMSLFHKGGAAGTSVSSGVTLNNEILKGRLPKKDLKAKHARTSGYVSVSSTGDKTTLDLNGYVETAKTNAVLVQDGQWVDIYEPLTFGLPDFVGLGFTKDSFILEDKEKTILFNHPNGKCPVFDIGFANTPHSLDEYPGEMIEAPNYKFHQRMVILDLYFKTFLNNKINIHARHFELVVRAQSHTIKIINSNIDELAAGNLYEYNFVKQCLRDSGNEYAYVAYGASIAKQTEVVTLMSGPQAAYAFERALENVGRSVSSRQIIPEKGIVGGISLGENLVTKHRKKLEDFTMGVDTDIELNMVVDEEEDTFEDEIFANINTTTVNMNLDFSNIDLNNTEFEFDDDFDGEEGKIGEDTSVPPSTDSEYNKAEEDKDSDGQRSEYSATSKMSLLD